MRALLTCSLCSLLLVAGGAASCGDVPSPDCPAQPPCKEQGLCTEEEGNCVAASDEDCAVRSEICAKHGKCSAQDGVCRATSDAQCRASSFCQIYGGCHATGGVCQAQSDADCQASSGCKQYGWCTVNEKGECVKLGP